jgi:hypothetical protein
MDTLQYPVYICNTVSDLKEVPIRGKKLIIMEEIDTIVGKRAKSQDSVRTDNANDSTPADAMMDSINAFTVGDLLKTLDNVIPS